MAEQALQIAREAKGVQQSLKEALKGRDPWDKEVEFQRKNLRRQHLRLLLVHPYAKESKDAENLLWMQTSYAFISIYKQRIATLDRTLQSTPRNQPRQGGHGPVEYRKLMQRFRQFLAEEERFWAKLIGRLYRSFDLEEAHAAIVSLGIVMDETPPLVNGEQSPQGNTNGRNHSQFPSEESPPPRSNADRAGRMAILSKAMVCLGDIARYRELYNESNGRPRAGHEESLPVRRGGRNRRGGAPGTEPIPRARNYDRAQLCYEQARLLVSHEGNPSHQLAILASYQRDIFGSVGHYYRALCVLQPYVTASENLDVVLTKALDQWKNRLKREKESPERQDPVSMEPRLRVELFREKTVVLHGLWRLGVDRMDSISPGHAESVLQDFAHLLADRALPIDLISKVIILSEGALWKQRHIKDTATSGATDKALLIESRIATYVLGLHRVLLKVGLDQLRESPPRDAAEHDLAQRITAAFRRMLPALRIAGKWLRANFKYVQLGAENATAETQKGHCLTISDVPSFWGLYAEFTSTLYRLFPLDRLPALSSPLDEDVDMRGFLPLRKLMGDEAQGKIRAPMQEHPNEEQLMRIADLLGDADMLVRLEDSPLFIQKISATDPPLIRYPRKPHDSAELGNNLPRANTTVPPLRSDVSQVTDREDDAMTEASRDDPVGDAFRIGLGPSDRMESDDDDDDQIVWNPRASASPVQPFIPLKVASPPRAVPMSPVAPAFVPRSPAVQTPMRPAVGSPLVPKPPGLLIPTHTATQDLVGDIMSDARDVFSNKLQPSGSQSTAPQPPLLFGSGPHGAGHSIWSISLDNTSTNHASSRAGFPSPHPFDTSPSMARSPQSLSQSAWPSSQELDPVSQHRLGRAFAPDLGPNLAHANNFGHRRIPSANVYSNPISRNDAFGYALDNQSQLLNQRGPQSFGHTSLVDPAIMASGLLHSETPFSAYNSNPLQHDPRMVQLGAAAIPQLWGNNG